MEAKWGLHAASQINAIVFLGHDAAVLVLHQRVSGEATGGLGDDALEDSALGTGGRLVRPTSIQRDMKTAPLAPAKAKYSILPNEK